MRVGSESAFVYSFAAILLLGVMSITLFVMVTLLERVLVLWAKEGK